MGGAKVFFVLCVLGYTGIARAFVGVIAPGKIRLGTNQTIFILGLGLNDNDLEYRVILNPGSATHTFYSRTHRIQNGVLTPINIMVNANNIVPATSSEVTLVVRSTRRRGFDREVGIEIDKSPGYLFVQVDKPIYTSRQKVKYRVMAVDEDLRWAPWQVQVSLQNPKGHLVDRVMTNASEAFTGSEFPLSKNPMKGIWKIRASYTNFSTASVTAFEVKDYVLPRFGVRVKSNQTSMVWDNTTPLLLSIEAEYMYGQPTLGQVSMSLVARLLNLELVIMNNLQYQLNASGQVDVVIDDNEMKDTEALRRLIDLDDLFTIYVKINMTEISTNNVVREEYLVATMASYPYKLTVVNERKYHQPGFPYTFEVEVSNIDGSIAENVPVVIVKMPGEETTTLTSDKKGRVSRTYIAPDSGDMVFLYQPEGYPLDEKTMRVKPVRSSNSQYVVIEVAEKPPLNRDLPVHVRYHGSPGLYFIMVSSRGQVVFRESYTSGTNGHDVRTIPRRFLKDMVTSARILVFYVASDHVVADSKHVLMKSACKEELRIRKVGNKDSYKPKETGQISLSGGANMRIGLLAVDKAVYSLKFEKSLTRKKMFDDLDRHDFGSGSGSAVNSFGIFEAAGFKLMYGEYTREYVPLIGHRVSYGRQSLRIATDAADSPPIADPILRSFFPESWLFEEDNLDANGNLVRDVKYPDSLTTWVMQAVGVSQDQGICISNSPQILVSQKFFLDIHLPFKAVKLEEVRVDVTVSSYIGYDTMVTLSATATADGLCMLDSEGDQHTIPSFQVPNGEKRTKSFSVLPVRPGTYAIRVEAVTASGVDRDIVERHLVVVSEGEPNKKTITFNLDPNGKPRRDVTVTQTVNRRIQETNIDLAFPEEAIPESENIDITASGDLLGDVISNIVLGSSFPSVYDTADTLMMELAPSCYGLQYLNKLNSLTPEVFNNGRLHIRYGVAELMKYRTTEGAFCLEIIDEDFTPEPSAWFTTFVLKSLCSTSSLLNIDEYILEEGYEWLLDQVSGSVSRGFVIDEQDPRFIDDEEQQLLAEVLISSFGCSYRMSQETSRQRNSLKQWWSRMSRSRLRRMNPFTLAKVAYARQSLNMFDSTWEAAVRELKRKRTRNTDGLYFWSDEYHDANEPIMYETRPPSETIEATAYALLVFVKVNSRLPCRSRRRLRGRDYRRCRYMYINPDEIAEWLIQWRNGKGLFVGATDTAVATEALAAYRESKLIQETNLDVNVTASPSENFTHRMLFDEQDAFLPKSLQDVPLGQNLHVFTAGEGIGQMHVETNYNVPVDVDANCQFTMNVARFNPDFESLREGNTGVCSVCGPRLTCPKGDRFTCSVESYVGGINAATTYCLNVCLKYNGNFNHGKTFIRVRMLSGYVPNECDLKEIEGERVVSATFNDEDNYVLIQLRTVSAEEEECVGFRIKKIHDVFRIKPATVTLRSFNVDEWMCPRTYASGDNVVSTPFYCPLRANDQMRGCSCVNDKCVNCGRRNNPSRTELRTLARASMYAFKLRALAIEEHNGYKHLLFNVEEDLKPCVGNLSQQHVTFVTRQECGCPRFTEGELYWVLGEDYNRYTDENGQASTKFFLNSKSYLLSSALSTDFARHSRDITRAYRDERERTCN